MEIVAGFAQSLPAGLITQLGRYRHRVFIEKLGWQLQVETRLEFDDFDRPDTLYVIAQNESGDVIGSARLLPTTLPYLLGERFPQLLNGLAPPQCPNVWELSRFAAMDFNGTGTSPTRQFSSPIAVGLLKASMAYAAGRGAKQLITVSPLGVERLLRRAGIEAHRAGPPMIIAGNAIFACWIDL